MNRFRTLLAAGAVLSLGGIALGASQATATMAATPPATRSGCAIRQAPKLPWLALELGQPTFRFTSS